MDLKKVKEILEPVIVDLGFILYDIEYGKEFDENTLTVLIDTKDGPMDLDMIMNISEKVSDVMDKHENLIDGAYNLNIASAGAERPIKGIEEFKARLDSHVNVEVKNEIDGIKFFQGDLVEVTDEYITIKYKFKTVLKSVTIKHEEIVAARTAVKF